MTPQDAITYLNGLGTEKYSRIMAVLSVEEDSVVNAEGKPASVFMGIVQKHVDNLEDFFKGKSLDDETAVGLAWFIKGILREE